ncbi:hypothetical protein BDZ94DRAFT_26986 [Collybia nuda]|uniref:Copper transporter n=1 Tax=Collybia nuda TaxID=64659 RepID=A0A9P5YJI0_9AGAR|nr:hypothetical protein BDZ94DRAFT_26986 [Collybia nuda]
MDGWEAYLHWSFSDQRVLISSIRLDSLSSFLVASILAISICVLERWTSCILEKRWEPRFIRRLHWQKIVWRSMLYWLVMFLRLSYMLVAMSFHLGLLLVMVTTLTVSQTLIEMFNSPFETNSKYRATDEEPLLDERHMMMTIPAQPHSKSRPDAISAQTNDSNITPNDTALDFGVPSDVGQVHGNRYE